MQLLPCEIRRILSTRLPLPTYHTKVSLWSPNNCVGKQDKWTKNGNSRRRCINCYALNGNALIEHCKWINICPTPNWLFSDIWTIVKEISNICVRWTLISKWIKHTGARWAVNYTARVELVYYLILFPKIGALIDAKIGYKERTIKNNTPTIRYSTLIISLWCSVGVVIFTTLLNTDSIFSRSSELLKYLIPYRWWAQSAQQLLVPPFANYFSYFITAALYLCDCLFEISIISLFWATAKHHLQI